ncbi:hypothetical protein HC891_06445 [Candidatus Gracilibacteria bacterium]|nr:hypothetical protein [Candidatus Gracilibacteria bacterium]
MVRSIEPIGTPEAHCDALALLNSRAGLLLPSVDAAYRNWDAIVMLLMSEQGQRHAYARTLA